MTTKLPAVNSTKQVEWFFALLAVYFGEEKKKWKDLQEANAHMKNFQFPPFEPATQEMGFEQKRHVMKNVFLIILRVYEKLEEKHQIDLSQFKNHARVLEQFEDMPQYLMKQIGEDFQKIQNQYSIRLPAIPFENWPDG